MKWHIPEWQENKSAPIQLVWNKKKDSMLLQKILQKSRVTSVPLQIFNNIYQNYLPYRLFVTRSVHRFVAKKEFLRWTFAIISYEFRIHYSIPSIPFRKIVTLIELSRKWVGRERYIIIHLAQTNLFLVSQSKHVYTTQQLPFFFFFFTRWFN